MPRLGLLCVFLTAYVISKLSLHDVEGAVSLIEKGPHLGSSPTGDSRLVKKSVDSYDADDEEEDYDDDEEEETSGGGLSGLDDSMLLGGNDHLGDAGLRRNGNQQMAPIPSETQVANGNTRSIVCSPYDNSGECVCQRSCRPNDVFTYLPCQCIEADGDDGGGGGGGGQQTFSFGDASTSPLSQSFMGSTCDASCSPYPAISRDPCYCDYSYTRSQMPAATGEFYGGGSVLSPSMSYGSTPISYNYPYFNSYDPNNAAASTAPAGYSSYAPTKAPDPNIGNKCRKVCSPFGVKRTNPCTCDFNAYKAPTDNSETSPQHSEGHARYNLVNKPRESHNPAKQSERPDKPKNMGPVRTPVKPRYIGCFKDQKDHGRDLKISLPIKDLTVEKCTTQCRNRKKRFAALQYGYLCFCGSRFGRYGRESDSNCTSVCVGNSTQKCGGPWLNSVYSTDGNLYSPTQFSFTSPDSIDEITAEEERRHLNTQSAKKKHLRHKKGSKTPTKRKHSSSHIHKNDKKRFHKLETKNSAPKIVQTVGSHRSSKNIATNQLEAAVRAMLSKPLILKKGNTSQSTNQTSKVERKEDFPKISDIKAAEKNTSTTADEHFHPAHYKGDKLEGEGKMLMYSKHKPKNMPLKEENTDQLDEKTDTDKEKESKDEGEKSQENDDGGDDNADSSDKSSDDEDGGGDGDGDDNDDDDKTTKAPSSIEQENDDNKQNETENDKENESEEETSDDTSSEDTTDNKDYKV